MPPAALVHRRRLLGLAALLLLVPRRADAEALPGEGPYPVRAAIDGASLALEDGRLLRLAALRAPALPALPSGKAWPLAEAAQDHLQALVEGRSVSLVFDGLRRDRHDRLLAQAYRDDGLWLQGHLLEAGLAWVESWPDNRARVREMLALEATARAQRRGLWALEAYRVLQADESGQAIGRFALVEGRVRRVATVRGRGYLNYGEDWREDFTVSLAPAVMKRFAREGIDLQAYEGRRLRVRGWLESFNGPMIELTHPEQIEMLQEP